MKRWSIPISILIPILAVLLTACNLSVGSPATTATPAPTAISTGTVIAATSSIPTSTPQQALGGKLPIGTLILTQVGKPIAQLPNRQTITLPPERFGAQGSPNGQYGIRFNQANNLIDITLVDFGTNQAGQAKDVPQGKGLHGPGVTWKDDSSGFAFFDSPPPNNPKATNGNILYYDVAGGQTKELVPAPKEAGTIASSIAFSPDGRYLLYATGLATAEGIGGPGSKLYYLDTSNNQSAPVPAGAVGFNQWLKDSKGFVAMRTDQKGVSQVVVYSLASLSKPNVITPANTADFLIDLSPDGKWIGVTSTPTGTTASTANIFIMNLDGSNRKQLTKFNTLDQTITALIWGNDGIYYGLSGADNKDTTWRMDLDGSNATQIAQGTLNTIIGAH